MKKYHLSDDEKKELRIPGYVLAVIIFTIICYSISILQTILR